VAQAAIFELQEQLHEVDRAAEALKQSIRDLETQIRRRAVERLTHLNGWQQRRRDTALNLLRIESRHVRERARRDADWSERTGWLTLIFLLGVLGWRVWFGY
jgi:hypothetical protein